MIKPTVSIGDVAKIVMGQAPPKAETNSERKGVPFVKVGEFSARFPVAREWTTKPIRMAAPGDVLVCVVGSIGKVNLGIEAAIGRSVAAIRPSAKINRDYLYYLMIHYAEQLKDAAQGTTQGVLSKENLMTLEVPQADIKVQERIVETLDGQLSRIDKALADLDHADSQTQVFRRSILNELLNPESVPSEPGVERKIEVPLGWKVKPLGEVADTQLGKMLNRSKQKGDSTIPYLRNVNVQWGRFDLDDVKQMDIYPEERSKFTAKPGDLLVCEGGESGRAAIWNGAEPIGIQNALHRIRPSSELSSKYLLYYFEWQVKSKMIDHLLSGVTITHLTQEKLRKMSVWYPAIEQQRIIVESLEDQLSRLDSIGKSIASQKALLSTMRRSILNKAFNGELGTN